MDRKILLEVNPSSCIIVIGVHYTRSLYESVEDVCLSRHHFLRSGIQRAAKWRPDEWTNLDSLLDASLIPDAAITKARMTIASNEGGIGTWLAETFSNKQQLTKSKVAEPLLQMMKKLQQQGCKLVYSHYDRLLVEALGSEHEVILPTCDVTCIKKWITGNKQTVLHLNGVYTQPDSVSLQEVDCTMFSLSPAYPYLKELFQNRSIVCLGMDPDCSFDPLVDRFIRTCLEEAGNIRSPPLVVSSTDLPLPSTFFHLSIDRQEEHCLDQIISIGAEENFAAG